MNFVWGQVDLGGRGLSVRDIRADADAPLVAGGDMGYVGSGGGGSGVGGLHICEA